MKETPILLLTGYLGSGKTTLVNTILSNRKGIRFAVIVNDLGEVNIDASLIAKGGVVGKKDDSLVSLQNGCICCTLKMDLVEQINDLIAMDAFDYIVIEASGICEPAPIAQTICSIPSLSPEFTKVSIPFLDCIVTVVDALRMKDEFACGSNLQKQNLDEEDIENLIIQQIEFCNKILLNKASEVDPEELKHIKAIIRALQPKAEIVECDYCDVDLDSLLHTNLFNFSKVATSAAWIQEMDHHDDDDDDEDEEEEHGHHHGHEDHEDHEEHEEHGHHHHHHHHHDEGEAEEYGIRTFVYYRRRPFDINKFDSFIARKWDNSIIRSKGVCWFADDNDMSYLFESAGQQKKLSEVGYWYATAPEEDLEKIAQEDPDFMKDWDDEVGDRMQKIVFIGQHIDKEKLFEDLDFCLIDNVFTIS